jgi:hypothetical protein
MLAWHARATAMAVRRHSLLFNSPTHCALVRCAAKSAFEERVRSLVSSSTAHGACSFCAHRCGYMGVMSVPAPLAGDLLWVSVNSSKESVAQEKWNAANRFTRGEFLEWIARACILDVNAASDVVVNAVRAFCEDLVGCRSL